MPARIDGLYSAQFTNAARFPQAGHGARPGVVSFEREAPIGLEVGQEYPAQLIPPDQRFGLFIAEYRPRQDVEAFTDEAGTPHSTLHYIERGHNRATFPIATRLYRALGGGTLCLAFFDYSAPSLTQSFSVHLVDNPEEYATTVGAYFRGLREGMPLKRAAMGRRVGVVKGSVTRFETGAHPPKTATVQRFFRKGVGDGVAYCGIGSLPPPS